MKCKEIQEKDKINVQLLNKKKVQELKEKGITLIALVVTIIILLILAGVTLNMALSGDGLFSRARNAADKYKKAQEDEQDLISEIGKEMNNEYVGAYVIGYNPTARTEDDPCTIGIDLGYTSDQTFITEEMKWRIWDYDGTTLRLISDKPTTAFLKLKDKAGYNNGVYAINEVCRQCYNSNETGVTVRNLRRSDIEAVSNYDYTKYKHKAIGDNAWVEVLNDESGEDLIYYGETKPYTNDYQRPEMWSSHDYIWNYKYNKNTNKQIGDPSCEYPWEQEYENDTEKESENTTDSRKFTQSYYYHNYLNKQGEFKDSRYYDLLFKDGEGQYFGDVVYWLAGRYAGVFEDHIAFGLHSILIDNDNCRVAGSSVFSSDSSERSLFFSRWSTSSHSFFKSKD